MVNVTHTSFSSNIDKTAKKPRIVSHRLLAHPLPKEGHGGSKDEKGFSKYLLFVGLNFDGDSGWSANTIETV
jgi:hypothetical protein